MAISETEALDPEVAEALAEWLSHLAELVEHVQAWSAASGWSGRRTSKHMVEKGVGRYEVPVLVLDRGNTEVALVPVARQDPEARGLVDLFLMPAYDDVASLSLEEGRWFIHDTIPPGLMETHPEVKAQRLPLDEGNLNRVLEAIAGSAHA